MRRRGFSLTEVAFALLLAAAAVVTVLLFFPAGIRAQTMARFKIIAAAKAMEIIELSRIGNGNGHVEDARRGEKEGVFPWDTNICYRAFAPDVECQVTSSRLNLKPLPLAIAARLDSDGDEMARVLGDGGNLYYLGPRPVSAQEVTNTYDVGYSPESARLVVAVVGSAQHNAILYHPSLQVGAHYEHWPSPPSHGRENLADSTMPVIAWDVLCRDNRIQTVWRSQAPDTWSDPSGVKRPYGYWTYLSSPSKESSAAYVAAALWYCGQADVNVDPDALDVATDPDDGNRSKRVLAMRYLAHAAMTLTRWYDSGDTIAVAGSFSAAPATVSKSLTYDTIALWHEKALALAIRYADTTPYDWGAPRPLNRQVMMDHPLCELDILGDPITATTGGVTRSGWRALFPRPVRNPGIPFSYPGRAFDTNGDGIIDLDDVATKGSQTSYPARVLDTNGDGILDQNDTPAPSGSATAQAVVGDCKRFTLAAPFAASERCRQLVFWAVDWQAYEDFETAPSAPIDSSRYPAFAPRPLMGTTQDAFTADDVQRSDAKHRSDANATDRGYWWWEGGRNPELSLLYTETTTDKVGRIANYTGKIDENLPDKGDNDNAMKVFLGLYGANRSGDEASSGKAVVNAGKIPASVRMRAVTVARFVYYDQRVPAPLRY